MYKNISKFYYIRVTVYSIVFIISLIITSRIFIKRVYADIPSIRVCVYTNTGSPLPASAGGVVRFRDKLDGCSGGNTRYLEIGKNEIPNGGQVSFVNNSLSYCSEFAPWRPSCANYLNNTQKNWLHNTYINVPGVGSQRRSPRSDAASFGCNECKPGYFGAFVNGYSCNLCEPMRFSNTCGTVRVNVICTPQTDIHVRSDVPANCASSHNFIIEGWDSIHGAGSIRQLSLRIQTDTIYPKTYDVNIYHSGAGTYYADLPNEYWLRRGLAYPYYNVRLLNAGCGRNACIIGGRMRIVMHVEGLDNVSGSKTVEAFASQLIGGDNTGFQYQGSFIAGTGPDDKTVEWLPDIINGGESSQLVWESYECSSVTISPIGYVTCSPSSFACGLGSGTVTASDVSSTSVCRASFVYTNTCGSDTYTENLYIIPSAAPTPDPWMMTGLGDAYAYQGYTLDMNTVSFSIPKGVSDEAYFSTYIISNGRNTLVTDRPSYRSYQLRNYNDANRNRAGEGFNFYEQLLALAESNGCSYGTVLPNTGCPAGSHVYFINGNATLNGWLGQSPSANRACAVIANGNITIPAGSDKADDVDRVDAFLIADGDIITQVDDEILYVNGSGIANTVQFHREYTGDDPSEIFVYDPKYIDLLRDCLGENYPYKVREYEYSNPE